MCVWKHTHTCLLGINTTFHMMNCQSWPEPVVRVQALAESGLTKIPDRFIKPESQRPGPRNNNSDNDNSSGDNRDIKDDTWRNSEVNIPVVDMAAEEEEGAVRRLIGEACREWGFFQVVNHGVRGELMRQAREMWREFFKQPLEVKEEYANSPITYEGYGSRLGVKKGAILDWSDYFFLHYTPQRLRDPSKWPSLPSSLRYIPFSFQLYSYSSSILSIHSFFHSLSTLLIHFLYQLVCWDILVLCIFLSLQHF